MKHLYRLGGAQLAFDTCFETGIARHELLLSFRQDHAVQSVEDQNALMQATVSEWLNELEAEKFPRKEAIVLLHSDVEDLQSRGVLPSTETQLRFRLRQLMARR